MVERFHCRLKDVLQARCAAVNWLDHLPWVLLGLCSAAREDDNTTPPQAQEPLRKPFPPGGFAHPAAVPTEAAARPDMTAGHRID